MKKQHNTLSRAFMVCNRTYNIVAMKAMAEENQIGPQGHGQDSLHGHRQCHHHQQWSHNPQQGGGLVSQHEDTGEALQVAGYCGTTMVMVIEGTIEAMHELT